MANNNDIITACQAGGATSAQYNTALKEFAVANGGTADDLPTALFQAFTALGYTGSLSDMFYQWEVAGFPGGSSYTHQWTIGNITGSYGYKLSVAGDLDPLTNPITADPITEMRVDSANYMYVKVIGSHAGTTLGVAIEGWAGEVPVLLSGGVAQWFGGPTAGLFTYISGQNGNTLGAILTDET